MMKLFKTTFILLFISTMLQAEYTYTFERKQEDYSWYLGYKDALYKVDFQPIICEGVEDGCEGTGIFFKKIDALKEPLIVLKALAGAHSVAFNIYNPNVNKTKEVKSYVGSYSLDYSQNIDGFTIIYDDYCSYPECPNYQIKFYSPLYMTDNSFYFKDDRLALEVVMQERVRELAKFYIKYNERYSQPDKQRKIKLIGHTSILGTDEYNFSVALRRAQHVKKLLVKYGVPKDFIIVLSYGEERQICSEKTKECFTQNDRVEFKIW